MNQNLFFFWWGGGGGGGGGDGARVSNFFTKNSKSKTKKILGGEGVWVGGGGRVDGRTDEQAQTSLPLQLLQSWRHNNE